MQPDDLCNICHKPIEHGQNIFYDSKNKTTTHAGCKWPNGPQCQTCAYAHTSCSVPGMAECRVNPPTTSPSETSDEPRWPIVFLDDWCGHWRSKNQYRLAQQINL